MLNRPFADRMIIDVIATTRTSEAMVPNSGTTTPSAISTSTEDWYAVASPCFALTVYNPS